MGSYHLRVDPSADTDPRSRRAPKGPRRRTRLVVGVLVVIALGWTAVATVQLLSARRHAQTGLDQLRTAQDGLGAAELIRGEGLDELRVAQAEFRQADAAAGSIFVAPYQVLPYVGRQVRSVRALSSGASRVVDTGVEAMEASTREMDAETQSGEDRIRLVDQLGSIGAKASDGLREVSLGPDEALLGPLASAREKFGTQLAKARRAVRDVERASKGISAMASGPSRYLVLAANQSEMRAGSGMLLSAGVLTMIDGRFTLGPMTSVTDLELPPGAVPLSGDYADRWGWLQPTEEWRYLAMSPQFDVTAELAARMWKAKTGEDVDGVLAIDAIALRALVAVSGPVEVDGRIIDRDNVVREVLLQQYLDNPTDGSVPGTDVALNDVRRDRNGAIAQAIVGRMDEVGWDISSLVDDLRDAARGRHVLFWSADPVQQRGWRAAGVSGRLPRDGFMVSLENRAGNKLDQFIDLEVALDHRPTKQGTAVTATITVTNRAPATGLSRYVEGPARGTDFAPGEYRGILAVNIPLLTRDVQLEGVERLVAAGSDATTQVIAGDLGLQRGETATVVLRFVIVRGSTGMQIVPSARYPAISYTGGGETWRDDAPHRVEW